MSVIVRSSIAVVGGVAAIAACSTLGCRDISRFSSAGDRYEGSVVKGEFVRSGVAEDTRLCVQLDADHLQDAPGKISSSDGRFKSEPLRPIPQLWHDPLSTLSFGEGREKNLLYVASSKDDGGTNEAGDVMVIVSLMSSGGVEVRLIRGAPPAAGDGGVAVSPVPALFGVFQLDRQTGACSF